MPEHALLLPPVTRTSADTPAVLWRLMVAVALFGTAVSLTITPRPALILAAAGSTRNAAFYTGILDAMTASIEIVGNPVLGLCSDVVGRRPVLLLSQFGELGALLIIAQFSTSIWPFFIAYLRKFVFLIFPVFRVLLQTLTRARALTIRHIRCCYYPLWSAVQSLG